MISILQLFHLPARLRFSEPGDADLAASGKLGAHHRPEEFRQFRKRDCQFAVAVSPFPDFNRVPRRPDQGYPPVPLVRKNLDTLVCRRPLQLVQDPVLCGFDVDERHVSFVSIGPFRPDTREYCPRASCAVKAGRGIRTPVDNGAEAGYTGGHEPCERKKHERVCRRTGRGTRGRRSPRAVGDRIR